LPLPMNPTSTRFFIVVNYSRFRFRRARHCAIRGA
jgi:hypothetical protein